MLKRRPQLERRVEQVFDTALLVARKRRAVAGWEPSFGFLVKRVADDLGERLSAVQRNFPRAAVVFAGSEHARQVLVASGKVAEVVRIEAKGAFLGDDGDVILAAPETVPLEPGSIDLAVSPLSLHATNDVPGLLFQIGRALRPDGLFLGAMAGAGTLVEMRESLLQAETEIYGGASPRVLPFADVRDAGALLQRAGFALPVADLETVTVRYASMFGLMRDLRAMGETSALVQRSRKPVSPRFFTRAAEIYADRFSDPDGRIRATFSIVWLSGWAPHESQPKPLRRGSAMVSLAKILENKE
jgi:SAM-dependent methyltransferase